MEEPGLFSGFFAPIEYLMTVVLNTFYSLTEIIGVPSYGLAIILLTVIIKILVYPLTKKQLQSMKAMQRIQPQMKKLQEKYKDNPQMFQKKLMELYQKEGANPMSGCLPMLIQMPILMGMYYTLFSFDYGGAVPSFLWLPSLSEPDPTYALPFLSVATTFLQQKMMSTGEVNQQMRVMLIAMPLFIGWLSLNFPAGLVLYWVTMNIVQIIQQWWTNRQDDKKEAL